MVLSIGYYFKTCSSDKKSDDTTTPFLFGENESTDKIEKEELDNE